jgi:hypothetical protein
MGLVKTLFTGFFFILSLMAVSAKGNDNHEWNIDDYYHFVYKAELCIIDSNFSQAAQNYDTAFRINPDPLVIDVYNYTICQCCLRNHEAVLNSAKTLVKNGADSIFFSKQIFEDFRKSKQWNDFVNKLPALRQTRNNQLKLSTIQSINDLIGVDQQQHCALAGNSDSGFLYNMHFQDNKISEFICDSLFAHGYIDESIVGGDFHDTIFSPTPIFFVLIVHAFEANANHCISAIEDAIKKGKVRPEVGLALLQLSSQSKISFTTDYFILNDTLRQRAYPEGFKSNTYNLLSLTPNSTERKMQRDFHLDTANNIIEKIKYSYKSYVSKMKDQDSLFKILPMLIVSDSPSPSVYEFSKPFYYVSPTIR